MQVTINARQLSNLARLGGKANEALHYGAARAASVAETVEIARRYNAEQQASLSTLAGTEDIFGGTWTRERINAEANEHDTADQQLRDVALALGIQ